VGSHNIQETNRFHVFGRFMKISYVLLKEAIKYRKFVNLDISQKPLSRIPKDFVKELIMLGPIFVKLGQILSTRPDFIPEAYIKQLKVLHHHVPTFDYEKVKVTVESELDKSITEVFKSFDKQPVASASLSQVHFAVMSDGTEVAVKIQRPNLLSLIETDMKVLSKVVSLTSIIFPKLSRNINLKGAFNEFKTYTTRELDFSIEAKTLERFRDNFNHWENVSFPKVYFKYTTNRVLTMERVSGLHLDEVVKVLSKEDLKKLNRMLVEMEMKMFISDAFFHADLHPGNIFFKEDGSIAVVDAGMFGELTSDQTDRFLLYWLAIVQKNKKQAFYHLTKLGNETKFADENGFYKKFSRILDEFYKSNISERSLTKTYMEIFLSGAGFGFLFPSQLLLQAKALTTAEALAFKLVPDFQFAEEARPIVLRELASRGEFDNIRNRLEQSFPEWLLLGELSGCPQEIVHDDTKGQHTQWKELGQVWGRELDEFSGKEVRHGEYSVIIYDSLENVFNFITRFAHYSDWHPTYTKHSRVIHVSGEYIFITPDVVGSVFRLDEIVDGAQLLSNGEVIEFERNKLFKWKAPLSLCPILYIGTSFTFEVIDNNTTRLHEYFYYIDHPVADILTGRKWFSKDALSEHIKEELLGAKYIIESERNSRQDREFLWEGVHEIIRL